MWERKYLDRNRGLLHDDFDAALKRANSHDKEGVRETLGDDIADPYGSQIKPKNVPVWDHPPLTPKEEAIYYGVHIHSESNPLGLHTHIKGGKLSGGHTHSPQNRFGAHTHNTEKVMYGQNIDGSHAHDGENCPAGGHEHVPENFG